MSKRTRTQSTRTQSTANKRARLDMNEIENDEEIMSLYMHMRNLTYDAPSLRESVSRTAEEEENLEYPDEYNLLYSRKARNYVDNFISTSPNKILVEFVEAYLEIQTSFDYGIGDYDGVGSDDFPAYSELYQMLRLCENDEERINKCATELAKFIGRRDRALNARINALLAKVDEVRVQPVVRLRRL